MFLCMERTNNRKSGQNLSTDQIQFIYHVLYDFEFRHNYNEKHCHNHNNKQHCQAYDPEHIHICLRYFQNSSDCHDRRIQHHTKNHDCQ